MQADAESDRARPRQALGVRPVRCTDYTHASAGCLAATMQRAAPAPTRYPRAPRTRASGTGGVTRVTGVRNMVHDMVCNYGQELRYSS
jgi:hypothetical protein